MIYTLYNDYFATGEGRTRFVLIGTFASKVDAVEEFTTLFGEYYSTGVLVLEGLPFTTSGLEDIVEQVPDLVAHDLIRWKDKPPYFKWYTQYHYNLS